MEVLSSTELTKKLVKLKEDYDDDVTRAHSRMTWFTRGHRIMVGVFAGAVVVVVATTGVSTAGCLLLFLSAGAGSLLADVLGSKRRRELESAVGRVEVCVEMIARVEYSWEQLPLIEVQHPESRRTMADDLALFGRVSLMQLLCVAETSGGRENLARQLLHPATADQIIRAAKNRSYFGWSNSMAFGVAAAMSESRISIR